MIIWVLPNLKWLIYFHGHESCATIFIILIKRICNWWTILCGIIDLCNICKTYQLALFCNKTSCFHFITFHYFFPEFVKRWAYLGHYSQTCDYVCNTIFAVVFEICSRKNWRGIIQRCPKHSIINGLQILACESWIEQIDQCNSIYNFELFGSKPKSPRWVHWNFGIESGGWW